MSIAVRSHDADLGFTSTIGGPTRDPATETDAWWAWECPCCGRSYESELRVCIDDGTLLRKVGHSLPFIWIG
jgi:hypothetical protein